MLEKIFNFPQLLAEKYRGLLVTVFTGVSGKALGNVESTNVIDTSNLQEAVWIFTIIVALFTIVGSVMKMITWIEGQKDRRNRGDSSIFKKKHNEDI